MSCLFFFNSHGKRGSVTETAKMRRLVFVWEWGPFLLHMVRVTANVKMSIWKYDDVLLRQKKA